MCINRNKKKGKDESVSVGKSPVPAQEITKSPSVAVTPVEKVVNTPSIKNSKPQSRAKSAEEVGKKSNDEAKANEEKKSEKDKIKETSEKQEIKQSPRVLFAKRQTTGKRDPKDPEYATLDGDYPSFQVAQLTGGMQPLEKTQQPTEPDQSK